MSASRIYTTRHAALSILLLLGLWLIPACQDEATIEFDNPDGDTPDGDAPDGDEPDGDAPDGDAPDGDEPDGDAPDGDAPDGDAPDGDEPDGDAPDGDEPDGDAPDGDAPDGDAPDGDIPPEACLIMRDAALTKSGADGIWSPGESATLSVTLQNICDEDFLNYPAGKVESLTPGVALDGGIYQLYGILAGQEVVMDFSVYASDDLALGTEARFVARATSLGCENDRSDCPAATPYAFSFEIAEPGPPLAPTDCLEFSGLALRPYIGSDAIYWEPDVRVAFEAVMHNRCDMDIWTYPGAWLHADNEALVIVEPTIWLFGIEAHGQAQLAWAVTADAEIDPDVLITFTVEATALHCDRENAPADCPQPNPEQAAYYIGQTLDPR